MKKWMVVALIAGVLAPQSASARPAFHTEDISCNQAIRTASMKVAFTGDPRERVLVCKALLSLTFPLNRIPPTTLEFYDYQDRGVGVYLPESRTIVLDPMLLNPIQQGPRFLVHELAHAIDLQTMTPDQRDAAFFFLTRTEPSSRYESWGVPMPANETYIWLGRADGRLHIGEAFAEAFISSFSKLRDPTGDETFIRGLFSQPQRTPDSRVGEAHDLPDVSQLRSCVEGSVCQQQTAFLGSGIGLVRFT